MGTQDRYSRGIVDWTLLRDFGTEYAYGAAGSAPASGAGSGLPPFHAVVAQVRARLCRCSERCFGTETPLSFARLPPPSGAHA